MLNSPIYSAIKNYISANKLRLHMPGHIGGNEYIDNCFNSLYKLDLTEVRGLDDFHLSQGCIEEARCLLAKAFKAEESFFLVNGASSGIHALLLAVTNDNNRVLIPRNAHKSFFAAMVLADIHPVYIPCEIEDDMAISVSTSLDKVKNMLSYNEDVVVLCITSPTYYGTVSDISSIVNLTRTYDKHVFVDEAHGSHFVFHDKYPKSAISQGASAVVNGLHKTLPVLNQGACIHIGRSFKNINELKSAISLITTTSPSYPILASIDIARAFMEKSGHSLLEQALIYSREYKNKINSIKGITCINEDYIGKNGIVAVDPLKVVISTKQLKLDGFQLANILTNKYNIEVEMAEKHLIVAMFSIFHKKQDWEKFYLAIKEIAFIYYKGNTKNLNIILPPHPQVQISPRNAYRAKKKKVKLNESKNKISAEIVAVYPPGIPCLLPGEIITQEIIDYIKYIKSINVSIHGPIDLELNYISIIDK